MICFNSDGSMQTKINACFCENCLIRDFINCVDEKGAFIPAQCSNKFPDSESSESDDSDDSDDGFDNDLDEMEQYKLRANSVYNYKLITINQTVQQGNIIALYSQPTAFE